MSGVDFRPVVEDTAKAMMNVVDYILGLNIKKKDKISRLVKVFNLIGSDFYNQMFNANSELFDSSAIGTTDYGKMTDQAERLSRKLYRNYYMRRDINRPIQSFYDSALGKAQDEAFRNAISLNKHPTLTRSMVGETCKWCQDLAGTHTNPTSEMFARHADCDCLFVVSGYNSRNGVLTNYNRGGKLVTGKSAFKNYKPKKGSVSMQDGGMFPKDRLSDKSNAEWMKKKYGGDYVLLKESRVRGQKMPDAIRNNTEIIEIKKAGSLTALDNRIKKGMQQLSTKTLRGSGIENYEEMSKILMVDCRTLTEFERMTDGEILGYIQKRISLEAKDSGIEPSIDYVVLRLSGVAKIDGNDFSKIFRLR